MQKIIEKITLLKNIENFLTECYKSPLLHGDEILMNTIWELIVNVKAEIEHKIDELREMIKQ